MSTKANGWNSPICITLIAATLALMGNIIATVLQTRTAEQLAHQRIQADLILQATKDPQLANQN